MKRPENSALPPAAVTFTSLKDGSLAVPVHGKTLYIRPVTLNFTGGVKDNAFARVQKSLEELLAGPAFEHLRSPVNAKYSRYLSLKAGLFLGQLKERHDPFYREFLNPSGDEGYGTFRAEDLRETEKKGVLLVIVNRGLYQVIDSPDPLRTTINNRFGRVGPDDCLLSGDSDRCRINALLCNYKKEAGLFIYPAEKDEERLAVMQSMNDLIAVGKT